jgi:hypothetical protein
MRLPIIRGRIDRRILVNYRVDPDVLAAQLPAPFRPKLVSGHDGGTYGMAGICLIRLVGVRPAWLPAWLGISSENAAHRVAVEWDDDCAAGERSDRGCNSGARREGVYVRRRDTNLWINTLVGGRLFPGVHHRARFIVDETADRYQVALASDDDQTNVSVVGHRIDDMPTTSIFGSLEAASAFFEAGSLGYSATHDPGRYDGLELCCHNWHVVPLEVDAVASSYFDDKSLFPPGSIELDCALLMRGIEHQWRGRPSLCCEPAEVSRSASDDVPGPIPNPISAGK